MLGFSPKLPIGDDERQWVDEGFRRLEKLLGRRQMLDARVITPTAEDFPDPYDRTSTGSVEKLFCRVCHYMHVDRDGLEFEILPDETDELRELLTHWRGSTGNRLPGFTFMPWRNESPKATDGPLSQFAVLN